MKTFFAKNPFTIFYIVFGYILVFSIWWAFLLYQKNETAFKERVEINQLHYSSEHNQLDYLKSDEHKKLTQKYDRQKRMILLEGSVFIILLTLGLLIVRRILVKELQLSELQKNFLLSVTHELKSPLASIKLNLQTMHLRKMDQPISEKLMNNTIEDVVRLESLVDNILFASKMESDTNSLSNEEINISDSLFALLDKLKQNAKQIGLVEHIQENVYLHTDSTAFISAVNNLLENAIKYSPEKTEIHVLLTENEQEVIIEIADKGFGIPVEERERIFEKFYRIGSENTRKSKGTGLGLFIVKKYIENHNGSIIISDNSPVGTVFTITLPKDSRKA